MANITLAIPDNIFRKMKKHREIRWSEVARKAIVLRIKNLEEGGFKSTTQELLEDLGKGFKKSVNELTLEKAVKGYKKMRGAEWKRASTTPEN